MSTPSPSSFHQVSQHKGWMLDEHDPVRQVIVDRAEALGITGDPDSASHPLGKVTLANGRTVNAFVIHAVDPVITDGETVVMINRHHEPGMGKPALPGGFKDPPMAEKAETAVQAAAREALEEVGIELGDGKLVGTRKFDRPYDVRVADFSHIKDPEQLKKSTAEMFNKYGVKEGDVFLVSTQAVRFDVPDLSGTTLIAGDDATPGSARRVDLNTITKDYVGIPDHADMIREAVPEAFATPEQKIAAASPNLPKRN